MEEDLTRALSASSADSTGLYVTRAKPAAFTVACAAAAAILSGYAPGAAVGAAHLSLGSLRGGWRRIEPIALEHRGRLRSFEIFEQLH